MKRAFLANESDGFILLFSIILFLGSVVVFFGLSLVIAVPVFDLSIQNIIYKIQNGAHPDNITLIKYFQVFQTIGMFIIPSIFIGFLINKRPFQYLQFNENIIPQLVVIVFFIILCVNPLINVLAFINQELELPSFLRKLEIWMQEQEKAAEDLTLAFLDVSSIKGLIFNLFMIAVLPALGEEMAFRGIIQKQFINISGSKHAGVFITAFIFSMVHLQFYGVLPRFILGLLLGYLLVWTGNIWYPIIAHFINNSLAVIVYYIMNVSEVKYNLDNIGTTKDTFIFGIISMIITTVLVILFYRTSAIQRQQKFLHEH